MAPAVSRALQAVYAAASVVPITDYIDTFKGLLILVVIMDHNDVAHVVFPATFRPLTFHVIGFLILPFLVTVPRFSWGLVRDRFIRYWVPFAATMLVSSILFWVIYHRHEPMSRFVVDFLLGVCIGSAPLVKKASGFLAYWFLPALFGTVVVLSFYEKLPARGRMILLTLFIVAHATVVAQSLPGYYWIPFGLAIVSNVFVLGIVVRKIVCARYLHTLRFGFPLAFVVSYGWLVQHDVWLEVMSLRVAVIADTITFIAQDVAAISGVISILLIARSLCTIRFLASIGHHSLIIYLLHPLVYVLVWMGLRAMSAEPLERSLVFGLLSYVLAVVGSWFGAICLARSPRIAAWITPRNWSCWGPVAATHSLRVRAS
jgi:hypothetical protein